MRTIISCAALAAFGITPALAQDTALTIWSWDIGAASLQANVASFEAANPGVTVTVEDLGNQQVFDRMLAACAAGGIGLPDIVSVENGEAEIFWAQFPDCFADLQTLGYDDATAAMFPDFKRTELQANGRVYAMPWDSGPVMMFYRRDFYENAGVDPAAITTWADFIVAGQAIAAANPGVVMTQADINGDTEFFLMIGQENGCSYFSADASAITVNSPACAETLQTIKDMVDAGIVTGANWGEKIQSMVGGTVATQMYGGWYEGTVRTNASDQAGLWGVYRMPSVTAGGPRAANFGGSALAISASSNNQAAAYAYLMHTLGTADGQITMLREYGLVPSLLAALDDPYVQAEQAFWGGQQVWVDTLATLDDVRPSRGTPFYGDAVGVMSAVQVSFLNGGYDSAQAAVDDAARQIALATGLPVAE